MEKCVHLSDYENILNVKKNIVLTARQDDDMYELFTSPVGIKTIIMSSAVCINQQNDKLVVSVKAGSRYDFIGFAGLAHLTTKYVLNYPPFQQFCSLSKVSIRTLTQNENVIFDFTIPAGCAENTLKAFTACLSHDRPPPSDYWIQSTLLSQTNDFQENLKSNSFFQLQYLLSRLFPPEHPLSCFPHCGQLGQLPQSTGRNRSKQSANVISNSKQSNQVDDSIDGNAAIVDEEFAIEMLHKVHEFFLRHYTPPRTCLLIRSIESIDHLKAVIQKTLLKKEFKHYFNQKPSKRIGYSSEEDEHPKFAAPQNVKGDLCILPFLTTSDTINPIVLEADFQGQDLLNSDASDRSQGENSNSGNDLSKLKRQLFDSTV